MPKTSRSRGSRSRIAKVAYASVVVVVALLAARMDVLATTGTGWTSDITTVSPAREGSTGTQLITGTGTTTTCKNNWVFTAGGELAGFFGHTSTATTAAQCFDPSQGTSGTTTAGSMNTPRADAALFQVPNITGGNCNYNIITAGGYDNSPSPSPNQAFGVTVSTSEKYNPGNNTWTNLATGLSAARWGLDMGRATVELPDGRFVVAGGFSDTPNQTPVATVDIFDSKQCAWNVNDSGTAITPASMSVARGYPTMGVLSNGHVLVCGGFTTGTGNAEKTCEAYTPPTGSATTGGSWAAGPSMNAARAIGSNGAYKFNDNSCSSSDFSCSERLTTTSILVAGGVSDNGFNVIDSSEECAETGMNCSPVQNMVTRGSDSIKGSSFPNAVMIGSGSTHYGGKVLLCGGYESKNISSGQTPPSDGCELYSHSSTSWSEDSVVDAMPRTRADAVLLETCGGGGGSVCTGTSTENVTAVAGQVSFTTGGSSNELTDVDQLNAS